MEKNVFDPWLGRSVFEAEVGVEEGSVKLNCHTELQWNLGVSLKYRDSSLPGTFLG